MAWRPIASENTGSKVDGLANGRLTGALKDGRFQEGFPLKNILFVKLESGRATVLLVFVKEV
jgi:hypothetical protein